MKLNLTIPGKTFLLGEYYVLTEGQAIVAATEPDFQLNVEQTSDPELKFSGIHPESPAGILLKKHQKDLSYFQVDFMDPHMGMGGLGCSTAQFALVYGLLRRNSLSKKPALAARSTLEELWTFYRNYSWSGKGLAPSGADLLGQWCGEVSLVNTQNFAVQSRAWGFEDLEFLIVHTGQKLATHEHLKSVNINEFGSLKESFELGVRSLYSKDSHGWLTAVSQYGARLKKFGFVAESTKELLMELASHREILASKGCGAMGADMVALFFRPEKKEAVKEICCEMNLQVVAGSHRVSSGIAFKVDGEAISWRSLNV